MRKCRTCRHFDWSAVYGPYAGGGVCLFWEFRNTDKAAVSPDTPACEIYQYDKYWKVNENYHKHNY